MNLKYFTRVANHYILTSNIKYAISKNTYINQQCITINKRISIRALQGNYIALPIPLWCALLAKQPHSTGATSGQDCGLHGKIVHQEGPSLKQAQLGLKMRILRQKQLLYSVQPFNISGVQSHTLFNIYIYIYLYTLTKDINTSFYLLYNQYSYVSYMILYVKYEMQYTEKLIFVLGVDQLTGYKWQGFAWQDFATRRPFTEFDP